ncbi:hypothetical protein [Streptosporangium sp. NBC_01756]|uniref:hypothetical protein n=1 Tax=Streptosporangium sp. NBC_01756 TaxID=2975950 RepID=UPI002DD9FFC5|nr:hypothetical protein [Streptosporangium sp. NBC_01756]WSC83690.1 hypothetical protein OIE48_25180 [Streptosporangium sp. NBC_01756]
MSKIDRMVSAIDPAAGSAEPALSQGVHDLLEEITATPPAHRRPSWLPRLRRARLPVLLATATALAVAVAIGLPFGGPATEYANAAVSIKKTDDHFSVTITDPAADRRRFEEAFRAVGLNVTVKVIPAAPDEVGTLVGPIVPEGFTWHGSIGVQRLEHCASAFCGKVWMPADFPGRVVFGVGRPAKPGEPYAEGPVYDPSGEEALDGYPVHGRPVATVRAELHRRGLKVGYRLLWTPPDGGSFDQTVPADRVKDDWIVNGSRDHSSDTVDLYVIPGPEAGPAPDPLKAATPRWYDLVD